MKHERYLKLKQLPENIIAGKIFTVAEYSRLTEISISSIYSKIDSVFLGKKKWEEYTAYQHRRKIKIVPNK